MDDHSSLFAVRPSMRTVKNRLENNNLTIDILGFYAKRAKLLAAFSVFREQKARLNYLKDAELINQAQMFARINIHYDFWQSCRLWKPIMQLYHKLVHLAEYGFVDPKMHKKLKNINIITNRFGNQNGPKN
ncbi:MAG: hypothetical protein LCH85_03100 [Chloroflexi bacterium]|nr:hypothetical protein [Chloroflexota bacterium]